ncbi:MAG: SMC-Scp complex subunit ScpB, partial [Pseudomonadota bacterium]|nr:SMC-Scp complex subunit ScpB [Pseudomonadota bacterium]
PGRRRQTPGRPLTWVTTQAFLDHFALGDLGELPGLEELKAAGLLDRQVGLTSIAMSDELPEPEDAEEDEPLDAQFDIEAAADGGEP